MKHSIISILSITAGSPAFAHMDGSFHTHDVENVLVLAVIAVAVTCLVLRR